jgi:hypothetical protein
MAANLYEPDHALMEGFFMELHGKMGAYLDLYHEFLLDVSSEELRLQGTTVFRVDQRETGITHKLFLEGVRHIGFHEGIPLEEVKSMVLLWSRSLYEDETDDQNFATRFWDLELSFVTAATLDAFSEDAAISREEKEKREEDIEAMLRSILDGSKELEGEKFGLSADELPAYARADLRDLVIEYRGMSAEELAQKWTQDDIDITQADRDGYSQRIVADDMSVVQRALRAMLGSLTRGDASERERVLDLTTRVLGALVARGHPTEAAQAVAQLNLIFQNDEWISNDARQIVREACSNDKVVLPAIKLLDNPPTARVAQSILNNTLATRVDVMVTRLRSFKTPEGKRHLASLIKVREPTPEMMKTLVEKSDLEMYEEALFIADGGDMQIVDQVWRSGLIHPNVAIRRRALRSVPKNRVMVLRDALHPLLNDDEKDIRTQVRDLIVSARDQGSIERFARIFNNARLHEDERRTAITAVATIGGPEASRVLMQGLAELNMPDLRVACALALGNHGDATAIPLLESIANKIVTWKSVRDACKEAVHRIQLRSGGHPGAPVRAVEHPLPCTTGWGSGRENADLAGRCAEEIARRAAAEDHPHDRGRAHPDPQGLRGPEGRGQASDHEGEPPGGAHAEGRRKPVRQGRRGDPDHQARRRTRRRARRRRSAGPTSTSSSTATDVPGEGRGDLRPALGRAAHRRARLRGAGHPRRVRALPHRQDPRGVPAAERAAADDPPEPHPEQARSRAPRSRVRRGQGHGAKKGP